jgi:hypothetical protein
VKSLDFVRRNRPKYFRQNSAIREARRIMLTSFLIFEGTGDAAMAIDGRLDNIKVAAR